MSGPTDLDLLHLAADIADRESMRTWRSDDLDVEIKPDGSPVSAADKLIERLLRELLAEHRPADRILGEEQGDTGSGSRCWVLDPIDGTGSYVAGGRAWGSLVALEVDGRPTAGMVTMPAVGRRWWGTVDDGAFRADAPGANPVSIGVSDRSHDLRWSTGPSTDELDDDERDRVSRFEGRGRYVPTSEWTTYPALMVAEGSLDLAVHFGQHWDHAALGGVVVAAGGRVDDDALRFGPRPDGRRWAVTFTNGVVDLAHP